jgi:hypothetical protein
MGGGVSSRLEVALEVLNARSLAAVAGSGPMVPRDMAALLMSGVAADAEEVLALVDRGAALTIVSIAAGNDPVSMVAGAMLETFVLGALVGCEEGAGA